MMAIQLVVAVLYFGSVSAIQPEPEEVSLVNVYNFFSSEMVQKRFYVQLVFQVRSGFVIVSSKQSFF